MENKAFKGEDMNAKALFVLCCFIAASCANMPTIDPCFTPGGNCLSLVLDEIGKAKSEILVQAHSLNAKPVADALVKAKETGVKVEIILDKGAAAAHNNAVYFSMLNGIPTYLDGQHAASDNNVLILDKGTVIAGNFKLRREADSRNAENVIIVKASGVADTYRDNWQQHKAHAEMFKSGSAQTKQEPGAEKKSAKKKKKSK
jgi:phosphatidylserine/phosphatidylglycerophosphate/cardiolipin synthase-like enzyme